MKAVGKRAGRGRHPHDVLVGFGPGNASSFGNTDQPLGVYSLQAYAGPHSEPRLCTGAGAFQAGASLPPITRPRRRFAFFLFGFSCHRVCERESARACACACACVPVKKKKEEGLSAHLMPATLTRARTRCVPACTYAVDKKFSAKAGSSVSATIDYSKHTVRYCVDGKEIDVHHALAEHDWGVTLIPYVCIRYKGTALQIARSERRNSLGTYFGLGSATLEDLKACFETSHDPPQSQEQTVGYRASKWLRASFC